MRMLIACGVALAILTSGGCALNRSEKGGEISLSNSEFRISAPVMGTSVKQGQVQTVQVNLHRGAQFNQDVDIRVKTPDGLSVEPESITIRASDPAAVQLVLTADDDAPIVTLQVEVEGTPKRGKATWVQFPVRITPR